MSLDCVKLIYIDTLNRMSDLGPNINPHMPMLLDPFMDLVLILLYFHVVFKVELLTFTIVMCGNKEPLGLTHHVFYIILSQGMVPHVTLVQYTM